MDHLCCGHPIGDRPIVKAFAHALAFIVVLTNCAAAQLDLKERPPTSCSGLAILLNAEIDRMRKLQERAKKEEKAPPSDLLSAWQRAFGKKGDGVRSLKELKKVRERADNLNSALDMHGCATIDIDQALRAHVQPLPAR